MTYLTAPEAIGAKQSYRYYVELASEQRDWEGVPELTRTIDVVVQEPTGNAIAQLIKACGWLKGYELVSYWEPDFDRTPF